MQNELASAAWRDLEVSAASSGALEVATVHLPIEKVLALLEERAYLSSLPADAGAVCPACDGSRVDLWNGNVSRDCTVCNGRGTLATPPAGDAGVREAARSVAAMVEEWYGAMALPKPHIPADLIEKRLSRFAALRSASSLVEPGGWRSMDSAPKDGTEFLAALSNGWVEILSGNEGIREGWRYQWWGVRGRSSIPYEPSHPATTDWGKTHTIRATHWMPLPPAPAGKE